MTTRPTADTIAEALAAAAAAASYTADAQAVTTDISGDDGFGAATSAISATLDGAITGAVAIGSFADVDLDAVHAAVAAQLDQLGVNVGPAQPVDPATVADTAAVHSDTVAIHLGDAGLIAVLADPAATEHAFSPLAVTPVSPVQHSLALISDVELDVTVELGRTRMAVRDVLSLAPGVVVELDRLAGSPVDVLVNGTMVARGEVVVIDEEFGVRISEIISETVRRG